MPVDLHLLLLCVVLLAVVHGARAQVDECIEYTNLTNWWRSAGYENDDFEHENLCDRHLDEGWYRGMSGAGGDMPKFPPGFNRCGTVYPIWLNSELPQGDHTTVDAAVCVFGVFSDCDSAHAIRITNCSSYNVYKLKQTNACPEAYCFGTEKKCPPGYHSPNGFYPGCIGSEPPILTQKATLDVEVRTVETMPDVFVPVIHFLCSIETPDIDNDLWFDARFRIGTTVVYEVLDIAKADLPAVLPETDFNTFQDPDKHTPNLGYGNNLTCVIAAKWGVENDTGRGVEVSHHYGFEVLNDLPIRLFEGEEDKIRVKSRLPVSCPSIGSNKTDCALYIELHVPQYHEDFQKCSLDDQDSHLVMGATDCKLVLTEYNWETGGEISVKPETIDVYDKSPRSIIAKFFSQWQTNIRSLSNLELPPIPITVAEQKLIANLYCEARCDPHMYFYDKQQWEMHQQGIFIMYTNKRFDTEVQIGVEKCNGAATCVCSVMVRSGLTVFVADTCGDRNQAGMIDGGGDEPPRLKMYDCHAGRNEMLVEKVTAKDYKFTLSTGTVVDVRYEHYKENYHNVYITPSVEDYQNAYGLCGYINEDRKTEARLRSDNPTMDYELFATDWKANDNESLWLGKSTSPGSPVYYCGCSETDGNGEVVCENTLDHVDCVDKVFTDGQYGACRERQERKRTRALTGKMPRNFGVVDDDDDVVIDWVDDDFVAEIPSWKDPWTEEIAQDFCEDYILSRDSIKACMDVPDVDIDGSIQLCVLDILLSGDSDASATHVDAIKGQCISVASRNLTMWKSNGDGNETSSIPPADIIEAGCLNECYDRGNCVEGVCTCFEGFSGVDCGTNDTAVPVLYKLPYYGVCDLQAWSCEASLVYGRQLFDAANLTCRVQHFQVRADGLTELATEEVPSYLERPSAAVCSLDPLWLTDETFVKDDDILGFAYGLSMSNDGDNFGNTLMMMTYNSKCANCTNKDYKDIACVARSPICKIAGDCYDDGEAMDAARQCMRCSVDTTDTDWTRDIGTCFIQSQCYSNGDANPNGQTCFVCDEDESASDWTQKAATCFIESQCYDNEDENPNGQTCFSCDAAVTPSDWTQKTATCFIESQCYDNGDENPNGQTCFSCDAAVTPSDWTQKARTCFIEGQCYNQGDENPNAQNCFLCDATNSTSDWTKKDNVCLIENQCYADDEAHPTEQCVSCQVDVSSGGWTLVQDDSCFIDSQCFANNAPHPSESCVTCSVANSPYDWTLSDARICFINDRCYHDMEASADKECLLCEPQGSPNDWTILGCLIDDVCRGIGEVNPGNTCELCSPKDSNTAWTPLEGCGVPFPDFSAGQCGTSDWKTMLAMLLLLPAFMRILQL